jgi:protein gp37
MDAGTPFLFKQWGTWQESSHFAFVDGASNSQMHRFADGQYMAKVGKHNSGRLLDGQEWNQFPK